MKQGKPRRKAKGLAAKLPSPPVPILGLDTKSSIIVADRLGRLPVHDGAIPLNTSTPLTSGIACSR